MDKQQAVEIAVDDVVFEKGIYPRFQHDFDLVEKYELSVGEGGSLPPITINHRNVLLDGWHRWTAHKKSGVSQIPAFVIETESTIEDRKIAFRMNSRHGQQLSYSEKQSHAVWRYNSVTGLADKRAEERELVKDCAVTPGTMRNWLRDSKAADRKDRERQMSEMWLACHTQDEIADAIGVDRSVVASFMQSIVENDKIVEIHNTFDPDFRKYDRSLYDVWSWGKKTNAVSHFGNSEQRIVQNLLALYTAPGDIVVDPFAGGGATIDVCRKHFRRYWVSDLIPVEERFDAIRQLDVVKALPDLRRRWADVKLVYLDPPYWKQAAGKYSDSPDDLANMSQDAFHDNLFGVLSRFAAKLSPGAKIALLISPTQWPTSDKQVVDHTFEMRYRMCNVPNVKFKQKFSVPYSTQQYNGTQVNIAKRDKLVMTLTRELTVWEVR